MSKKLMRDLKNNIETDGYLNSINILFEDLLNSINIKSLPLKIKRLDYKQFIKQISFEYDYSMDYSKLIVRLTQILPFLVDEMNDQSDNKTLLIYLYPESGLSTKEQLIFSKMLKNIDATVIVQTESPYFLGENIESLNYLKNNKQKISNEFIEFLYWNAPLNFKRKKLEAAFVKFFNKYCRMIEINPVISNYKIADIVVFEFIDFYVCLEFLKHCNHEFILDVNLINLPKVHVDYIQKFL